MRVASRIQRYVDFDHLNRLYLAWQVDQFASILGNRILEVGCGVGGIINLLDHRETILGLDVEPEVLAYVQDRFRDRPECRFALLDLTAARADQLAALKRERFDTVVCINVLEHIEHHRDALARIYDILEPGGALIVLVPAHMALYGAYDRTDGHFRRYDKAGLRALLADVGYTIVVTKYFNMVGAIGWWVQYRLLKKQIHGEGAFGLMNRLIPVMRWVERRVPPRFGLSLVAIAQKAVA